jgi:hypothetical protein
MDIGQWIVISLCIILVLWYFIGLTINRRRGILTFNWLQTGLEQCGEISEKRWLGSSGSGALLVVEKAQAPFRRIEVIFWLEAREILPMWLLNRVRNKRDVIILKAGLKRVPSQEVRLSSSKDQEFKQIAAKRKMSIKEFPNQGDYLMAHHGKLKTTLIKRVEDFLARYGDAIQNLTLQKNEPQFLLRMYLHPLRNVTEEEFFEDLSRLVNNKSVNQQEGDNSTI